MIDQASMNVLKSTFPKYYDIINQLVLAKDLMKLLLRESQISVMNPCFTFITSPPPAIHLSQLNGSSY